MGRKAKIDDATILNLLDQFFIGTCKKDVSLLKIPAFAEFVRKNGYEDVQDYVVRRNSSVRERIEELKSNADESYQNRAVVFRNLDIDSFLAKNTSPTSLKKALVERDNYYQQLSESAGYCIRKYNEQDEKIASLMAETDVLKADNDSLSEQNKLFKTKIRSQQEEIQKLRAFIDTYVNPEIANELLKQDGLLKTTSGIVSSTAIEEHLVKADADVAPKNNVIRNLFDKL